MARKKPQAKNTLATKRRLPVNADMMLSLIHI